MDKATRISDAIDSVVTDKIMVRDFDGLHRYKAYQDANGWYIRQGKRGTMKIYLADVKNICTPDCPVYEFSLGE